MHDHDTATKIDGEILECWSKCELKMCVYLDGEMSSNKIELWRGLGQKGMKNGDYEKSGFIFAIEAVCITLESKEYVWKKEENGKKT